MGVICLVDNVEFETVKDMHIHLRTIKMRQQTYYQTYHPRFNLLTGAPIPFKSFEQYFAQDFGGTKDPETVTDLKNEIRTWVKKQPARAREWSIDWLKKRRDTKSLTYAPSQVELRTLPCPSKPYFDSIGGYYAITRQIGYHDRYDDKPLDFVSVPRGTKVIQDSREQQPLKLDIDTVIAKVDCGDYALHLPHDKGIYIERKSLADMCGTLSLGNERFRRELERATKRGHYVVMLVEETITAALNVNNLPHTRHVKAKADFLMKRLRDLLIDFPFSFQAVFVDGRLEAATKLVRIFELGDQVKTTDLQAAYEEGRL